MRRSKQDRRTATTRLRPIYAVLAAASVALVMLPVASAGATDGPVATKSANSLSKKVKRLKLRLAEQDSRLSALEKRLASIGSGGGLATPAGPAGGDLTGTYPNPTIGADAVAGNEILNNSVTGDEIAPDSLSEADLDSNSVTTDEIVNGAVGSTELRGVIAKVGNGVGVTGGGSAKDATVSCPSFYRLIAGGYAWQNDQAGTSIIASAPDEGIPNSTWVVSGRATQNNTLYAWATCLPF